MKKFLAVISVITIALGAKAQTSAVANYINTYKELAISEEIRTGVPASITLAQGIVETEAGQSDLVKQSNNHFGIKCKNEWTGAKVYHDDDAKGECFRSYGSAEESYRDHSDFLKNRPNYAFLFTLDPTDYQGWAKGLKKAGYATSNVYAQMLTKIIVDNNLQQYTLTAMERKRNGGNDPVYARNNTPAVQQGSNAPVVTDNDAQTEQKAAAVTPPQKSAPVMVAQTPVKAPAYPNGVFAINDTKVIYAAEGTSLFAVANYYNLRYKKLLDFNELDQVDILSNGQLIFLERKPKKGAKDVHTVEPAETIALIAQREGVRLESLLDYNHLTKGLEPLTGEKIYLRGNAPAAPKTTRDNNRMAAAR
ncbi:glucosaminidase domain-containing protein [Deminuibacter soli]|uniref:Peptidoglycan hydrolase n=1 Tax=Deminuibacter soli TaxID=2291815 RepID=A0A3E1NDZ4_9BACT|nr:glucosaminidase domain-containing protein [Deminuibacter soli]RFM26061.1 hypothetical protein DXN05_22325 [Deminuibacter soli]